MSHAVWHSVFMRFRRPAMLLVLALALLQSGTLGTFGGMHCLSDCATDDDEGQCSPVCTECACCARRPILAAVPVAPLPAVAAPRPLAAAEPLTLQSDVAGRIFRPPRLDLSRVRW
jgi:hypothetical protein